MFCAPSTRIYLLAVFENALFIALNSAFCPLNKTMKFLKQCYSAAHLAPLKGPLIPCLPLISFFPTYGISLVSCGFSWTTLRLSFVYRVSSTLYHYYFLLLLNLPFLLNYGLYMQCFLISQKTHHMHSLSLIALFSV